MVKSLKSDLIKAKRRIDKLKKELERLYMERFQLLSELNKQRGCNE